MAETLALREGLIFPLRCKAHTLNLEATNSADRQKNASRSLKYLLAPAVMRRHVFWCVEPREMERAKHQPSLGKQASSECPCSAEASIAEWLQSIFPARLCSPRRSSGATVPEIFRSWLDEALS